MDPGKLIAAIALIGGGYWLVTGVNPLSLFGIDTSGIDQYIDPRVAAASQTLAQQQALAQASAAQSSGKAGYAASVGGAGAAAGIATTAGVAASTALLVTGIGAAGGLLLWGITQKGWFRGGEEGIKVNPARDEFLNTWVKNYYGDIGISTTNTDPVTGVTSTAQYNAMVRAFHDAGVNGNIASQTIQQLYAADTMKEFEAAANNFLAVLQSGPALAGR